MPRTGRPRVPTIKHKDIPKKFYVNHYTSQAIELLADRHQLSESALVRMVLAKHIRDEFGQDINEFVKDNNNLAA